MVIKKYAHQIYEGDVIREHRRPGDLPFARNVIASVYDDGVIVYARYAGGLYTWPKNTVVLVDTDPTPIGDAIGAEAACAWHTASLGACMAGGTE